MVGGPPSAHNTHGSPYFDTAVLAAYNDGAAGGVNVAMMFCINCHSPHKGNSKPYILRQVEQNTCYLGAGSARNVTPCHGTGTRASGNDVESILNRTYGHPVNTIDGVHTDLDTLYGEGNTRPDDTAGKGLKWSDSKHAECVDCHNPHLAGLNKHAAATSWYPTTPSNSAGLAQGYALFGVPGVEPSWSSRWTQPTTFTTQERSTKEYQICMKCHSYWGLGAATPGRGGETSHLLSKHTGVYATDQAWEFNPYNRSAHPVVMSSKDMVILGVGSLTYGGNGNAAGRYAPPLAATYLKAPWNTSPGTQTMMCSDCHGAEDETTSGVKGPHGSSRPYMLKGTNGYWPAGPSGTGTAVAGGNLYKITDIPAGGSGEIFCLNCHNPINYPHKTSGGGSGGMKGLMCVECHVAIPHGSPVSRLQGYKTFPRPYNYSIDGTDAGRMLKVEGFFRQSAIDGTYTSNSDNMWATGCGGGGNGCHGGGPKAGITYDSYP